MMSVEGEGDCIMEVRIHRTTRVHCGPTNSPIPLPHLPIVSIHINMKGISIVLCTLKMHLCIWQHISCVLFNELCPSCVLIHDVVFHKVHTELVPCVFCCDMCPVLRGFKGHHSILTHMRRGGLGTKLSCLLRCLCVSKYLNVVIFSD